MNMRRITAATATALLLAATAACSETNVTAKAVKPATVAKKACANGTYTWFNVEQPTRLTGLSAAEKLGKGGGTLKHKLVRLYTPRIEVTADGPVLASKSVLTSLGRYIGYLDAGDEADGVTSVFVKAGTAAPELDDGKTSFKDAGTFVQYDAVRVVEADFRYSCSGGRQTTGHAVSWTAPILGLLECGTAVTGKDRKHNDHAVARVAARIACGADSVAAKS
jgi:hypothetical protein